MPFLFSFAINTSFLMVTIMYIYYKEDLYMSTMICVTIMVSIALVGIFATIICGTKLKIRAKATEDYRVWIGALWKATMAYIDKWMQMLD